MAQQGYTFRSGSWWYLRYRDNFPVDGKIVRRQKCVKLCEFSDRYRCESDLDELVEDKLAGVRAADKCPRSSDLFSSYVEDVYLPFAKHTLKPSTYSGYKTYFERYIKPRVGKYALRDFTISLVAGMLKDIAAMHKLNRDTVTKIRSVLSGIFTYAMSEGHFPARSAADNPASRARIPETATEPKRTVAATFEEVQSILRALNGMPLERAAVAIVAMLGTRPGEARGLRWSDWDRPNSQISIQRAVWHRHEGTPKTPQSVRFVAVSAELREILLTLWNEQGRPLDGYVLAGTRKKKPIILDNLAKRSIADALNRCAVCHEPRSAEHEGHDFQRDGSFPTWPGFYALRRFHGTAVRAKSNLETTSRALGNSKAIADRHYVKPTEVLPDVREAVNASMSGLVQ